MPKSKKNEERPKNNDGLHPICYMVMPYRKKKVEEPLPAGAPAEIDFDALWEKAYRPAIEAMGYLPIRGDFDSSSVIMKAMLERIAFADLVIADVTLGNGNVYYEVGIRHVAKETACVLVAADWSRPLFDISQFACVRFPLQDGDVPNKEGKVIRKVLEKAVPDLAEGRNPFHELLEISKKSNVRRGQSAFRQLAEELSAFQADVRAVRLETDIEKRGRRLKKLRDRIDEDSLKTPEVALDLVALIRDTLTWEEMRDFIEKLPPFIRKLAFVREQEILALAKNGDPVQAIAELGEFIRVHGDTPERSGLLGGRYKQLWRVARTEREARKESEPSPQEAGYLDEAIRSYERGMELDFNQYYCPHNLALLLRSRKGSGDGERAAVIDHFVLAACERARKRDEQDEWLRATALGAAFRTGDVETAAKQAQEVAREGHAAWKLETTMEDLKESLRQTEDGAKRTKLAAIYKDLVKLLPPAKKSAKVEKRSDKGKAKLAKGKRKPGKG